MDQASFKAGKVSLIPARDPVKDSGQLRVELLDDAGASVGYVDVSAAAISSKDERIAVNAFAYEVDEAPRKAEYRRQNPLSAGEHNYYRIELEVQEDFSDWFLRQRGDRERFAGLDEDTVREWQRHR